MGLVPVFDMKAGDIWESSTVQGCAVDFWALGASRRRKDPFPNIHCGSLPCYTHCFLLAEKENK